jgi:hypothetical protein
MTLADLKALFDYSPDMTYADVVYRLIYGLDEAVYGFTTAHQRDCLSIQVSYYNNITKQLPPLILDAKLNDLSYMVSYFLRNVDPVTKACLWTSSETLHLYFPRGYNYQDLYRIGFNLIYRFGYIFDSIYELIDIFLLGLATTYLTQAEWQHIGSLPGKVLSNVFYPDIYELP